MNMEQEDYSTYVENLRILLEDQSLEQSTVSKKAEIYKMKLITSLMKRVNFYGIDSEIGNLFHQHTAQIKLSQQLFNKLPVTEGIVAVPVYAKEAHIDKLIDAISQQQGDFCVVLYLNANKESVSEQEFHQTIESIQKLLQNQKRYILLHHHYDNKVTMGQVRDHLLTSIYLACDENSNPVLIGLDADTYRLGKSYVQQAIKHMKSGKHGFVKGQLRRVDHEYAKYFPYAYLEDMIEMQFSKYFSNSSTMASSGGGTSYLLNDIFHIGGYDTSINMGEDVQLGSLIRSYYGRKVPKHLPNKVFTSPRRALYEINQGNGILDQWNMKEKDFAPIGEFDETNKSELLAHLDAIVNKIIHGENIEDGQLWDLNERINLVFQKLVQVYRNSTNQKTTEYKKLARVFKTIYRWLNYILRNTNYKAEFIITKKGKLQGIFVTHPEFIEKELLKTD